tara:strand:- start:384 stop:1331 length:948 start_codon:yes stop_codon:yes gene_type:complete
MAFDANAGNWLSGGYQDTSAGLEEFIPQIWGQAVQETFDKKLVMTGLGTDWSPLVASSGDYIRLPLVEDMGTGTVTDANTLDTAISYTDNTGDASKVAITINQHSYSAAMIEDMAQVQSSYDLLSVFTERMGAALALKVDDYLEDLINTALDDSGSLDGLTVDGGSTAAAIDQTGLATIIETAVTEDADLNNWTIVVHPAGYGGLFKVDAFVTAEKTGFTTDPSIKTGFVGKLGGMDVILSNNLQTAFTNGGGSVNIAGYLLHKSCLNYAYSIKPRVQTQYSIDNLAMKVVADVAYGGAVKGSTTAGEKTAFAII